MADRFEGGAALPPNRTGAAGTASAGGFAKRAALALFLGTTVIGGAVFVAPAHAQSYAFSNVRVTGNQYVDAATIATYAGIGRGQQVSAAQLNDAYQRIMNSGLFETVELTPQGGTLTIAVRENPMINRIAFEGNNRLKDENLEKIIQSKSRRIFSPSQAEADAAAIADAYRTSGRVAATVDPKVIRRNDNRVDLVFEIREGDVSEVESINFTGNRAFSDTRLRRVLASKQAGLLRRLIQSDSYVEERIEFDKQLLTDFYRSRGYADFQILSANTEFSRERDAFFVNFNVREGQRYSFGNVTTGTDVPGLNAAEFAQSLRLKPGSTYTPTVVDENIARLERLANQKGMNFIRAEPRITRDERNQLINIEFFLTKGERVFIERIDIEGNTTTLDQVVRRQFRVVEGDPYNPREIRQTAERIKALGFFSDSKVETRPGSTSDQVIVDVDVTEQPTGSLSFGVSYGVSTGAGFSIGFSESNFLGRGQYLGLNLSSGTDDINSNITFVEPWFLDRDLRLKFTAYYNVTESSGRAVYDTRVIGIAPSLEFPVSEFGRLELKYRIAEDKISNVSPDSSAIIHRDADRGAQLTSALGYAYSFDNRKSGLNPNAGVLLRFGQEFAGIGGDIEAVFSTALAVAEMKVRNDEVTLRAEFEGGNVHMLGDDPSRITDRYFLRGKMRGFERNGLGPRDLASSNEDALGGNMFAVARFEAEFPLGLPEEYGITGGVFWDVGSVWSLDDRAGGPVGGPVSDVDDGLKWRSAIGFSIYWTTPLGPLRFNFSKALLKEDYDREQNFDLTISTRF